MNFFDFSELFIAIDTIILVGLIITRFAKMVVDSNDVVGLH